MGQRASSLWRGVASGHWLLVSIGSSGSAAPLGSTTLLAWAGGLLEQMLPSWVVWVACRSAEGFYLCSSTPVLVLMQY